MPKVDLHLVSWDRPKMTELVIKTIMRNTKPDSYRLVVLDNGSSGDTPEMLQQMHEAGMIDEYIPLKTNLGLEAARNFMFKHSTYGEYFICVDNDCLPPEPYGVDDWVERLVKLMEYYEDYAAIACRTQVLIGTGNIFESADEHNADLVEFPHPGGSLRIMRAQAVHEVGGWAREEPGRGAEERYICEKLRNAGYKTGFAAKINTLHLFGLDGTDSWGYRKNLKPEDTGHSDISHPALTNGDDLDEVKKYSGYKLGELYAHGRN